MDALSLVGRYRERLAWSYEETLQVVTGFVDDAKQVDELAAHLIRETGIDLSGDDDVVAYRGKPFAVLAFRADSDGRRPDERIDTDSEVLALEAFSELLNRPDLEHFLVLQFRSDSQSSRELLRYDRRSSEQEW